MDIKDIPIEHTAAILRDNDVIHSGKSQDMKRKWELLLFEKPHGIYQYALKAINDTWYRYTWIQF